MLKRITGMSPEKSEVKIEYASFPKPFDIGLEFNAPVHGTWNIVHIGMQVPQAHQIYVCADNCMRGVVMTAAEMGCIDRFSSVLLYEKDLLNGSLEEETIEGVTDVLNKLEKRPPIVLLFTVCLHHFLGCDLDYVYEKLEERFPDITFARCFMDPILQRTSLTPDQKLRMAMLDIIKPLEQEKIVYVLGCDVPLQEDNYIKKIAAKYGYQVKEIWDLKSANEYMEIGNGAAFVVNYPMGLEGVSKFAKRLNRPYAYLPFTYQNDEIRAGMMQFNEMMAEVSGQANKWAEISEEFEPFYADLRRYSKWMINKFGETEIGIDYTATPRPLGLAKLLLDFGFNVTTVYLDSISEEEYREFVYLKQMYPMLSLNATIHVEERCLERGNEEKTFAIGQKAAWLMNTEYFVNEIEGGGHLGFEGMFGILQEMEKAFDAPKDLNDIVPRKGTGLCSMCQVPEV